MCGIALLVSGARIDSSSVIIDAASTPAKHVVPLVFSVDELKAALRRRGPDSLGCKKVLLNSGTSNSVEEQIILSVIDNDCISSATGEADLYFIGATLQLRGVTPILQPLIDSSRNILVYNGEIFGGVHVDSDSNDAEVLLRALEKCCSCNAFDQARMCVSKGSKQSSVIDVLSAIKGPWAVIYWQVILSDLETENGIGQNFWEELPCGIYSLSMTVSEPEGCILGKVRKHEWASEMLKELIRWERTLVEPKPEDMCVSHCQTNRGQHNMLSTFPDAVPSESVSVQKVLNALRKSVMRRSSLHKIFQVLTHDTRQEELAPVAVLFSGGLDSMILAALLNECLNPSYEIDLLNVSFDGQSAPDRISGKAGVKELRRLAPLRRWRFVEIDAKLSNLISETKHVMSLITPANTYMDLNIAIALWLAAGGDGLVHEGNTTDNNEDQQGIKYKSKSRIILVGSGADEQCAGYGRHRTKYRNRSWLGLNEEMKLDMQRIWRRNLGRDDRCCADNSKEARFPFLDEDVIRTLLDIPLWEVANLDLPSGTGDKKILREVARMLGLYGAAVLPKRAIQFGSRIARESNRKNFGSNRAANQASAGSVIIHKRNLV